MSYRAPNTNSFAERGVRTVREECLDKRLVIDENHLRQMMHEYSFYYNNAHPHQGIAQQTPIPENILNVGSGPVLRHDVL